MKHNYSIGDKYKAYYNSNNPNNKKFQIRGIIDDKIIDDKIIVILSSKGNYSIKDIYWFDFNIERGVLKKVK